MPELRVDPLLSYARRAGARVQVVLAVTGESPSGDVKVGLRADRSVDEPATITPSGAGRFVVDAHVDADRLGEGTWQMRLIDSAGAEPQDLQTRLLLRSHMPVALLPGPPPNTVLPEPEPPTGRSSARLP
jgi:hypothetical protein